MTTKVFKLTLVRHGETAHNRQRLLQGQIDTQLSERGREQAYLLAKYLEQAGVSFDKVYSSDLSRALETCKLITRNQMPITHSCQLRERHCGPLEGLPLDEARQLRQAYNHCENTAMNNNNNNNNNNNIVRHTTGALPSPVMYASSSLHDTMNVQYSYYQHQHQYPTRQQQQQQQQVVDISGHLRQQIPLETSGDVRARVRFFCEQILFPAVRHRHHVLVVSHAGCIRELMNLFKQSYGAPLRSAQVDTLTPNTGLNVFDILLTKGDSKPLKIIPLHLHQLPHLTFDVYNRDNPHPRLQNIHSITSTRAFNIPGAHAHFIPPSSMALPLSQSHQQLVSPNNNNNNNKNDNNNNNNNNNNNQVVVENYKQWDELNYKDGKNFDSSSEELTKSEVKSIFMQSSILLPTVETTETETHVTHYL